MQMQNHILFGVLNCNYCVNVSYALKLNSRSRYKIVYFVPVYFSSSCVKLNYIAVFSLKDRTLYAMCASILVLAIKIVCALVLIQFQAEFFNPACFPGDPSY